MRSLSELGGMLPKGLLGSTFQDFNWSTGTAPTRSVLHSVVPGSKSKQSIRDQLWSQAGSLMSGACDERFGSQHRHRKELLSLK